MRGTDYRQGDYRVVADRLRPAAEQLVGWCAPGAGDLVVDVAAGSGNVSLLCAARGARAVAVDRVVEQLRLGRTGSPAGVRWVVGDAHGLPLRDGIAAAALSTFGVIYADRPEVAVSELGRVCRSGGTIGLTAWAAGGSQEQSAEVFTQMLPTPDTHDHIALWGAAEPIAERLASVADSVEVRTGELTASFASVDAWWSAQVTTAPRIVTARQQLSPAAFEELGRQLREVARSFGRQDADGFVLRDSYLLARGRAR